RVGVDFTPPGVAGRSAVGFGSPSGGGEEGDLISSGISRRHKPPAQYELKRTLSFISLRERSQRERESDFSSGCNPSNDEPQVPRLRYGRQIYLLKTNPNFYRHTNFCRRKQKQTNALRARLCLIGFDQIGDALGVGFAVTVAGDGIGAAGGFDDDLSPEDAGGDVDGGDFRDGNALFVAAEHPRFHAADALRADDQAGGEKEIAVRPAAGGKGF